MGGPLTVRLWGVRGSIPTPGETTLRHGGNTTCVSVEWGEEKCLVLDAGTGIRALGRHLSRTRSEIFVLVTHSHWDHIQGFPFFAPLYHSERVVHMFPAPVGKETLCSLIAQMDGAHFPIRPEELMSRNDCVHEDPISHLAARGLGVSQIAVNHPGGAVGYRVDDEGRSVVFIPDNELMPPGRPTTDLATLAQFCRGADVLIHDAQYLPEDMPAKHGWGHSVVDHVLDLAARAGVKHLVLFHHDPDRTDDQLDAIGERSRTWLAENAPGVRCSVAREGMRLDL